MAATSDQEPGEALPAQTEKPARDQPAREQPAREQPARELGEPPATPAPPSPGTVPVCAIGTSAGGVSALQALFRQLPDALGLAYVVILHLAPDHPSAMGDILATCTTMPVLQVQDGPTLKPDHVYVIAPDRELVIEGDRITARPFSDPRFARAPIDLFFRSVATGRGDGIAVILTGAGSDGAVGVRAMKEAGGVILVQEPAEADYPMMPRNAIATGTADFVGPIARLAERLAEVARSKQAVRSLDMEGDEGAGQLRRVVAFLRARTGHDFSSYKRATVMRRVLRRMQVQRLDSLGAYAEVLRDTPEEAAELFSDLLISVTSFFRDPSAFQALARQVIAPVVEEADEAGLRAWVVGCATGEEAYSLVILMMEEAARQRRLVPLQVFASDLDEGALATAREGRYPRAIEADVTEERLRRFFVDEGTHYRVRKEVRDAVLFTSHSALKDPPFLRLDLVSCRNLLIYLERALQQQLVQVFHYSLKPGRTLFLGSAETVDAGSELFLTLDREARLYRARPQVQSALPILPQFPPTGRLVPPASVRPPREEPPGLATTAHATALEHLAPPSVLVDGRHDILHLSPNAGRFLQHSGGPFSNRLSAVARPELRLDLKVALGRALDQNLPTITHPVLVAFEDHARHVAMHVAPVPADGPTAAQALVFFLDSGPAEDAAGPDAEVQSSEIRRLHAELKGAQEALVTSRAEREVSVEDLRAANEELQSLNEEYRSTAEELETSKEELQSINEELQTVNAELKHKLDSISVAHSDLQNLTASTEIGTMFLDAELRIRMFTLPIVDLFNVTQGDVGRPLTDFTHRLDHDGIEADVRRVLRELSPVEHEVRDRDGRWYLMRLRPYRTVENRIDGVVLTFVDITARREAEAARIESERRLRALVEASSQVLYRMSADWSTMYQLTGGGVLADTSAPNRSWLRDYIVPEDQAVVLAAIHEALGSKGLYDLEHRVRRADSTVGWVHSRAVAMLDATGAIVDWFGSANDVSERRAAELAVRESEERFRRFGEASLDVLWIAEAASGRLAYVSPAYDVIFGRPREHVQAAPDAWLEPIHPDDRAMAAAFRQRLLAGEAGSAEYRIVHPDGTLRRVSDTGFPIPDESGHVGHVGGIVQDVTGQRAGSERQTVLLGELQHRVRNTLAVVRSLVRRTKEGSGSLDEYADSLSSRLAAFARVQGLVTRSADTGADLGELLAEELLAHGAREGERAHLDGPPLRLRGKAADTLGLVVHELATNAVKHGALAGEGGRIDVSWTVEAGPDAASRLRLVWRESGVALAEEAPRRRGFGSELIERQVRYELGATTEITYAPGGITCTIDVPLARLTEGST